MPNTLLSAAAGPILPDDRGNLILDPLRENSVALNTAVSTLVTTGARQFVIPVVAEDAAASWTAEGEEITPTSPVLRELEIIPPKVAGLVPVSREVAEDSSPAAAGVVGDSLAAAITSQVDAAFFGNLAAPAPKGLGSLTPTVIKAPLTSLDPFLDAKAASASAGGVATAVLIHPDDALVLSKVRDETGSNRPLVGETGTVAGLPLVVTRHAKPGEVWVVDARTIYVVVREDIAIETSRDVYFSSDRVAVKAVMRVGFGFVRPEAIVRIDVSA